MEFTRLKITGFKSFATPVELPIERGLTGIVGPNGCGKSNLVEAMRWLMGESSMRTLRAADADEIIFSGTSNKSARNFAEVMMKVDNRARKAPSAFNDDDEIEIIRRLDRGQGSTYRINGRVVRASDVRLIFADASSGARSPSLVAQGQIGELIAAKPTERRRIIEEAAGISGLYARRQDAERRLRRTEENLDIAETLLGELERDVQNLDKQARQAMKFRALSDEIKRIEAQIFLDRWRQAGADILTLEAELKASKEALEQAGQHQIEAAKTQALMARDLPTLRSKEAELSASVQRLIHERDKLEDEKRNLAKDIENLDRIIREAEQDQEREKVSINDAEEILNRLAADIDALKIEQTNHHDLQADHTRLETLSLDEVQRKQALAEQRTLLADYKAERKQNQDQISKLEAERTKLIVRLGEVQSRREAVDMTKQEQDNLAKIQEAVTAMAAHLTDLEALREARKGQVKLSQEEFERSREHLNASQKQINGLKAEIAVLQKLLEKAFSEDNGLAEHLSIVEGYEAALGAALGDEIKASIKDEGDPRWRDLHAPQPWPKLPAGVPALSDYVRGSDALALKMSQVGLVEADKGLGFQAKLQYGQALVSKEGDIWRWDGFVRSHKALSPLAGLLQEKNRLERIRRDLAEEEAAEVRLIDIRDRKKAALYQAEVDLDKVESEIKRTRKEREEAQQVVTTLERAKRDKQEQRGRLDSEQKLFNERLLVLDLDLEKLAQREENGNHMPNPDAMLEEEKALAQLSEDIVTLRSQLERLDGERKANAARFEQSLNDQERWRKRREQAQQHITKLNERVEQAREKRTKLVNKPDVFEEKRKRLQSLILDAEENRQFYVDKLNAGENQMSTADHDAMAALSALGEAKATLSRQEEKLVAARERRDVAAEAINETFQQSPAQLLASIGGEGGDTILEVDHLNRKLEGLKQQRERMGGVNLLAEQELNEKQARLEQHKQDIEEISETVRQLRQAIIKLNREGRARLLEAFSNVNEHFKVLFDKLFPGGTAHLVLTESDDPLDAGLEIHACPPGKKLQNLTLLSGGEQTLTALALIFAVFLTNPSPVCVLDEADAPLDDVNTLRYCELLEAMVSTTSTRFLVVTHNPLTMSKVDCLFGVTMAERGVSTIVSVNLREAEKMVDKAG